MTSGAGSGPRRLCAVLRKVARRRSTFPSCSRLFSTSGRVAAASHSPGIHVLYGAQPSACPGERPVSVASSKAKLAGLIAHRDPADPDIVAARAQLAEANARARAREIVATWPPLSAETKAELAVIILGGGDR